MTAPFALLEQRLTAAISARLSNVIVHTATGEFPAQFDIDTTEFFDGAKGADFTLRYAGPNPLSRGDYIRIVGSPLVDESAELQVYEKPTPLGAGYEYTAALVRAA